MKTIKNDLLLQKQELIILMWAFDQLFSFSLTVCFIRQAEHLTISIFMIPKDKFFARHPPEH